MSVLTRLALSLPIAVASWMIGTNAMTAAASQNIGASKATQLLARSRAVDKKCTFLTTSEHQELSDYLAKAEISAARRESVKGARGAVKRGNSQGLSMSCNNDSEIVVRATMDAARRAMHAVRTSNRTAAKKRTTKRAVVRQASVKLGGGLKRYSNQAAAYYVERRCRHLPKKQTMNFWRKIVSQHHQMIDRHGPDAVRVAKNKAIARSQASGACGTRTAKLVRAGFSSIRRN